MLARGFSRIVRPSLADLRAHFCLLQTSTNSTSRISAKSFDDLDAPGAKKPRVSSGVVSRAQQCPRYMLVVAMCRLGLWI